MIDSLESQDPDLGNVKRLLGSKCWTENEKNRWNWLTKWDRESLISLCQFLRSEVVLSMERVNNSTPFWEIINVFIRLSAINGCIFLLKEWSLEPIVLSWELKKLSNFAWNASRVEEEIEKSKEGVFRLVG